VPSLARSQTLIVRRIQRGSTLERRIRYGGDDASGEGEMIGR